MRTILSIVLICLTANVFSQSTPSQKILVSTISTQWDKFSKKLYFIIQADEGVNGAEAIYSLKPVSEITGRDVNDPSYNQYVKNRLATINYDSIQYNYFPSESAALNFITGKGWSLQQVIPKIPSTLDASTGNYTDNFSYNNVFAIAKYIFVKPGE